MRSVFSRYAHDRYSRLPGTGHDGERSLRHITRRQERVRHIGRPVACGHGHGSRRHVATSSTEDGTIAGGCMSCIRSSSVCNSRARWRLIVHEATMSQVPVSRCSVSPGTIRLARQDSLNMTTAPDRQTDDARQSQNGTESTPTPDTFVVVERVESWRCSQDVVYRFMTTSSVEVSVRGRPATPARFVCLESAPGSVICLCE